MMHRVFTAPCLLAVGCLAAMPATAQRPVSGDVRLFQSFYEDARISSSHYAGGRFFYGDFDNGSLFSIDGRGGFVLNPDVEIEGNIGFADVDPDNGDGESGLLDPFVTARYRMRSDLFEYAVGGFADLPVGDEDLGQDTFDFGAYGAVRFPLDNRLTLAGNLSLSSLEIDDGFDDDRELSVGVGVGVIGVLAPRTHLIGELAVESELDDAAISFGIDHLLANNSSRARGALILGLDDGAPDIGIDLQFLFWL